MSIQKILKAYIICPDESVRDMMRALQLWGGMETISVNDDRDHEQDSGPTADLAKVKFILEVLERFFPAQSLWKKLKDGLPVVNMSRLKSIREEFDVAADYENIRNLDNRINTIESGVNDIDKKLAMLRRIITVKLSAADILFDYVDVQIMEQGPNSFIGPDNPEKAFVERIEIDSGALAAVFSMKEDSEQVEQELTEAGARKIVLPDSQVPASRILELEEEKSSRRAEIDAVKKEIIEKYGSLKHGYDILAASLENSIRLEEELGRSGRTSYTSIISGWVPDGSEQELAGLIKKTDPDSYMRIAEAVKDDDPPVVLANNSFSDPFKMVTNLYGTPEYGWIDPTPYVAPFFILFFGLCLTDAGYGMVISAIALAAMKKLRLSTGIKRFMMLMFWGGLSSVVAGALTGGWFGNAFSGSGFFMGMRILDPLEKPELFMYFSLGLGYIHVILGVLISIFKNMNTGNTRKALFEEIPWIVFLLALPLCFVKNIYVSQAALYVALSGLAGVLLLSGHEKKNIFSRFISGILNIYGGTDYFKDMISYSRLFALGMGTAILAMAVNELSQQASMFPVVGPLLMVAVLLVGHSFNIVMNVLSGYIHTSRLQYVEFFKWFFKGGGRMFSPFEWKHKKFNISK